MCKPREKFPTGQWGAANKLRNDEQYSNTPKDTGYEFFGGGHFGVTVMIRGFGPQSFKTYGSEGRDSWPSAKVAVKVNEVDFLVSTTSHEPMRTMAVPQVQTATPS